MPSPSLAPHSLVFPSWAVDPRAHFAAPLLCHLLQRLSPKRALSLGDATGDLLAHLAEAKRLAGLGTEIFASGDWSPARRAVLARALAPRVTLIDDLSVVSEVGLLVAHSIEALVACQRILGNASVAVVVPTPRDAGWHFGFPHFSLGSEAGVIAWGVDARLDELIPESSRALFPLLGEWARECARARIDREAALSRLDDSERSLHETRGELAGVRARLTLALREIEAQSSDRERLLGIVKRLEGEA